METTTYEERLNGLNDGGAQATNVPSVQPAEAAQAPQTMSAAQAQEALIRQDYTLQHRATMNDLFLKVRSGELDIDDGETQDMLASQYCRMNNVDPTRLFYDDELAKAVSNGKFANRRELGRAVYEMMDTAERMDYSGWQTFDEAEKTGDRAKLIEACNKLTYGDNTEVYRNDWSEHEIARVRRSTKQKDMLFGFLGSNFESLSEAGKAGFIGAVLMSRGNDTDDLVECGLYKGMSERDTVDALFITEMLRAGHTVGFMDFAREASRVVDAPVNVAKGLWQIAGPGKVAQGLRVSELLEKNGGIDNALKKPAVRAKLVEELDSWSTPFHFWTDKEIRRKAEAAKRLGDSELSRRRMLKLAESIAGSPKLLETGEAMRYALEAAGTAAEMTGQMVVQIGALAGGSFVAGPAGGFIASTATIALMESGDSYWDYMVQGMSQQDAAILATSTGAAIGALNTIGFKMISPTLVGKVTQTAAQKSLLKAGVKIGGNVSEQAAKLAQGAGVRAGVIGKIGNGVKAWGKSYLIEGSQEVLEEAIVSSIELSSDYWRADGQDLFNLETEMGEIADTAVYMAKYGMWSVLPMSIGEGISKRKSKPVQRALGVAAKTDGSGVEVVKGGVSLVDSTAAERAAQAYNDARQQSTEQGIPKQAVDAWGADLTGEQRAELKEKYKLTDEQVETLDAMAHYERLAAELGDTSIDMENDIKKLNEELDKMSEENRQQVLDELKAEDDAEANAANANPAANTNTDANANANPDAQPAANPNEANNAIPLPRRFVGADGRIYNENAAPSAPVRFKVSAEEQTLAQKLYEIGKRALSDGAYKETVRFAPSEKLANLLKGVLGNDVGEIIITADTARHINNRHGNPKTESNRGQVAMKPEDFAVLPYLLNNADSVELSPKYDSNGNRAIEVRTQINGVSVICTLEQGANKQIVSSGWRYAPTKKPAVAPMSRQGEPVSPELNARNASADVEKVKQDLAEIKSKLLSGETASNGDIRFSAREENSHGDTEAQREAAEIIRKAKENGTWMKAPNGKPTKLSEKQWVQVRTKAFKKWFGDWEKAARIEKLKNAPSITLKGYTGQYELNRDSARKWLKENLQGKEILIRDTGETVKIGKTGRNKVTSHGIVDEVHLKSVASISEMLDGATFITEETSTNGNAKYKSYRYYVAGVKIDGVSYTAKIVIGVASDGSLYYDHALTKIEKSALVNLALEEKLRTQDSERTPPVAKDTRLLEILQADSSRIVDENGEPLVVYHGTRDSFTKFEMQEKSVHGRVLGDGFYFTSNYADAHRFANGLFSNGQDRGGIIMPAFIKIVNPTNANGKKRAKINRSENSDGVIDKDVFVVDEANQIKSATDNTGAFDASNPDIRFSADNEVAPAGESRQVSEAKKKLRNLLLTNISSKTGVKIVRLSSEQIEQRLKRNGTNPRYSTLHHGEKIYGYYDSAKQEMVLNEDFADFDTPIHEWTHVWWDWVKKNDPRLIERITYWVRQTEEYKKLREEAEQNKDSVYHNLANNEEALVQEVFARLCGKKGAELMSQEGVGTWAKIRRCVLDFYKGLLRTLGLSDEEVQRLTFEDLQGMCLRDLFDNETLGLKGVRARISNRAILNDAIDNAEIDEAIKDANRKRLIRNASVLVAAKLLRRRGFMSAKDVDAAHDEILADVRKALPTESSDVHEAVIKVASLYAKMIYSTREATAEAITDAAQAVHEVSRVQQELRSERILAAAFKKGVIGAELYAEAKEYVERYTKMTETGRGSKEQGLTWQETNALFGDGKRAIIKALFDKNAAESITARIAQAVAERLGANAKPWDVLQATRRTLVRNYKRVAKTWVHSAAREQALKAIEAIEDADSMDAVLKAAEKAERILREKGIRLTTRALISQIDKFVKRAEARIGDSRAGTDKRKYSGEFAEFVKAFSAHFKALADAADKMERASRDTQKGEKPKDAAKLAEQAQQLREEMQRELRDIVNRLENSQDSAETRGLQARLQALTLIAGVDFTDVEQLSQLFETLSKAEQADAEMKFGEKSRFAQAVEADAKKLTEFVNARTDKSEYDAEAGFGRKTFGWLMNYVFNLKQRFEHITAYAKGVDRDKRNAMLKRLHRQEVEANLRKEKEKHRRLLKFRNMLKELGYDTDSKIKKFSTELSQARKELAKFSYSGKVAMSYDQLLNLYLGLRQNHVSAALLAMDEDTRNAFLKKNEDAKILWHQIEMMDEMKKELEKAKFLEYGEGLCRLIGEERTRVNEACAEYFGMNLMMFPEDASYFPISRMKKEGVSLQTTGSQANIVPSAVLPRIPNMRSLNTSIGATAAFMHHVEEVEHFVAYGKLSRYYTALFSNKDFCRAVYLKFGEKTLSNLRNAVADTVNGQFYKNDDIGAAKLANTAVNISSVMMLGWNIGTALKQVSSFWVFANEIGWKNAFLAMCYNDEQGYRARINEMMNHPLWHARYGGKGSAKYMQEIMSYERGTGWWKTYSRVAMATVRAGDAVAVLIVGQGLYGATKATLMKRMNPRTGKLFTEEEATDMAMATVMDIADRTQQAGRTANFNVAQRRGGALARIIGQFQSSLGQMMGAQIAAAYDLRAQGLRSAEARRKFISTTVNNHLIIPGITWGATLLIKYLFRQEPPEDDDAYELIAAILAGQAGGLFLVGGLATQLFSTSSAYAQANFPVMSSVSKIFTDSKKLAKSFGDGKRNSTKKAVVRTVSDLSAGTRDIASLIDSYIVDLDGKKK